MKSGKKIQSTRTEVDASYLYSKLAAHEPDERIAQIFKQMSDIERRHAETLYKKYYPGTPINLPGPSMRARTLNTIGRVLGYNYVLGVLMDTEKSISNATLIDKKRNNLPLDGNETNHVEILHAILQKDSESYGSNIARFESRHRSVGGNALRAAVLGGNDGLVSNFSLVMGVAGATTDQHNVLITGIAGLLAGALSMALGEWISVKSSQELYENQMRIEMEELETNPQAEEEELSLIYMAKGVPATEAKNMAAAALQDKNRAHQVLIREELGIEPEELKGSALEAAIFSFILFAIGAIIPVIPYFFSSGIYAIIFSVVASMLGLFFIGTTITLFTGKSILYSGMRQVIFGLLAAAITFSIGKLIGASIAG